LKPEAHNPPDPRTPSFVCVACSIFRKEIESLQASGELHLDLRYLPSMLHLEPQRLEQCLTHSIAREHEQGHEVILAFGDCCAHMLELTQRETQGRTRGINCCEILLGSERYRTMRREGVFFLLPEWTLIWRRMLQEKFGFGEENARSFMRDMHTRIVYLDTGLSPQPLEELAELAQFTGLPVEILPVTLENLLASLKSAFPGTLLHE